MTENQFFTISTNVNKKIIKKGRFGRKPSLGWTCGIILTDEEGKTSENLKIKIGNACSAKDRLIEFCVQSMHIEEESSFLIQLPKESKTLEINIVLTQFKEKPYIFQWTEEEKLEASRYYKTKGTELFKAGNIEEAFYKFSTALKFTLMLHSVLETDETDEDTTNLITALYNNLAGCHIYFKNFPLVLKLCNRSLKLHPTLKAYYRRALANIELRDYGRAETDLVKLLKIEPKNKAALEKYKLVRELDKSNRQNYESIVKKMFR